jgi:hypothetical protein
MLQTFMLHQRQERGRSVRWQQFMSSFNMKNSHVPGKFNTFVNGLSRRPDLHLVVATAAIGSHCSTLVASAAMPLDPVTKQLLVDQRMDSYCRSKLQDIKDPRVRSQWQESQGVLLYTGERRLQVFVPEASREKVMRQFHDTALAGRCGWKKVLNALTLWCYWPAVTNDVKSFVQGNL